MLNRFSTKDTTNTGRISGKDPPVHCCPIVHGDPVTISKCKFQAHISRISTASEAEDVLNVVKEQIEGEAELTTFVCPFAYRIASPGGGEPAADRGNNHNGIKRPSVSGAGEGGIQQDDTAKEGGFDNGDVGSGDKLLYLLQKWDIRGAVLVVTRIDGGFAMAEIMGIRRYKIVIDRARRLLEDTHLTSLRRAVDTDLNSSAVEGDLRQDWAEYSRLAPREDGSVPNARAGGVGKGIADQWDRFVMPSSTPQKIAGKSSKLDNDQITSGFDVRTDRVDSGFEGVWRTGRDMGKSPAGASRDKLGQNKSLGKQCLKNNRPALALAQLSISSKTVAFPAGHVPSVMGAKGYGKKRGRINHFAVKTPCPTPPRDSSSQTLNYNTINSDKEPAIGGSFEPTEMRKPTNTPCEIATSSGWSLPHELDPTSALTCLEGGRTRLGNGRRGTAGTKSGGTERGGGGNLGREGRGEERWVTSGLTFDPLLHGSSTTTRITSSDDVLLASRASSTINSPAKVSSIVHGVFAGVGEDHDPFHHPPPAHQNGCVRRDHSDGKKNLDGSKDGSSAISNTASSSIRGDSSTTRSDDNDCRSNTMMDGDIATRHLTRASTIGHRENLKTDKSGINNAVKGGSAEIRRRELASGRVVHDSCRLKADSSLNRVSGPAIDGASTGCCARRQKVWDRGSPCGEIVARSDTDSLNPVKPAPDRRRNSSSSATRTINDGGDSANRRRPCGSIKTTIISNVSGPTAHHQETSSIDLAVVGGRPAVVSTRSGGGGLGRGAIDGAGSGGSGPTSVGGWKDDGSISTVSDGGMGAAHNVRAVGEEEKGDNSPQGQVIQTANDGRRYEEECGSPNLWSLTNNDQRVVGDVISTGGSPAQSAIRHKLDDDSSSSGGDGDDYDRITGSRGPVRGWTPSIPVEHGPRPPPSL